MNALIPYLLGISFTGIFSSLLHGAGIFNIASYHYLLYSDIPNFFNKAVTAGWPYLNSQIEYPVLIGLFVRAMGLLGKALPGYYIVSSLFLILLGIGATYLLYLAIRVSERKKLWQYWVFAPSMLVFSVYNWDLLAVFCVVAAIYAVWKKQDLAAVLFLVLGTWAKLYPVLYILPLLMRQETRRAQAGLALAAVTLTAVLNLPFALGNFDSWAYFFTFNSGRISTFDSIWTVIRWILPSLQNAQIISALSLLIFASWYFWMIWKFRKESMLKSWYLATLIFMMTNKVFSPQYLLWLLPFFIFLPAPSYRKFLIFEFSNLILLGLTLTWFFAGRDMNYFYLSVPFILIKYGMMLDFYRETSWRKLSYRVLPYEVL